MKTNISDGEWARIYPIFGFLFGRTTLASHKRQMALFDRDCELAFIFQVTAELNFHHYYSPQNMLDLIRNGVSLSEISRVQQVPVSALSLANIAGIPRESARRKLKKLVEKGLLLQGEGGYMVTEKAMAYYFQEVRQIYEDFALTVNTVEALQQNLHIV